VFAQERIKIGAFIGDFSDKGSDRPAAETQERLIDRFAFFPAEDGGSFQLNCIANIYNKDPRVAFLDPHASALTSVPCEIAVIFDEVDPK
jgi:hypothetical protein